MSEKTKSQITDEMRPQINVSDMSLEDLLVVAMQQKILFAGFGLWTCPVDKKLEHFTGFDGDLSEPPTNNGRAIWRRSGAL